MIVPPGAQELGCNCPMIACYDACFDSAQQHDIWSGYSTEEEKLERARLSRIGLKH